MIDNLEIEAAGLGYALYIGNTTDHFRVIHCRFSNASGGSGLPYFSNSGITLYNVMNGNVTNNTMNDNAGNGIYLNSTNWCDFTLNDITQNEYGMMVDNSSANNTIYHNNFLGNSVQAWDDGTNVWNQTVPAGGNHWSDWTTPDNDLDGFVDNMYAIPGSGEDPSIPAGYYDPAIGLSGTALKSALHNVIKGHTTFSYTTVWDILRDTDEDPNNSDNVLLLYSGWSYSKLSNGGGVSDWNREHTWPKSHGSFDTNAPAGTDVHHLRPTDVSVNGARGSLDNDNGGTQYIDGDGATQCYRVDGISWEPWDEVKGDVARMMFYMATRYDGDPADHGGLDLELQETIPTSGPNLGKLSVWLTWHDNDLVSDWERQRNDKIYTNWQGNRNPFIDHPDWADSIWGSQTPATGGGGSSNRDHLPFAIQDGWDIPIIPGPVHNIDKGTDHHMIQWAIDNATAGDRIIVDDGTYFENVIIDLPVMISATDNNAIIDGGGSGTVVEIQVNGVELSGFEILNGGILATNSGIYLNNADLSNIHDNDISGCYNGIYLSSGCDNNTLENNTIHTNTVGANVLGSWNTIYHNNFLTNTNHTKDTGLNTWDFGFPIGGNFFDNWTTPDSNTDGFVDDPFIIPTGGGGGTVLDIGNYRLEQYDSSQSYTIPAGTFVDPEGYAIIGRNEDKSTFEAFWGVTLASNVVYLNSGEQCPMINGAETYELFDDISTSIDGPTGYSMASGNSAQRTATYDDGTQFGSWNVVSIDLATPGSGAVGDDSAGLVINEYSDASTFTYEFVELYYDSPSTGGSGSNNQDNWPFTTQDGWLTPPISSNHTIPLEEGWNLISTPFANVDQSIDNVLLDIIGKWDYILTYDPTATSHWRSNATYKPSQLNDLSSLDHTHGFWINITEAGVSLFLEGYEVQTTVQLRAGWNLIGYPTLNNTTTIAEALAGTGYTRVEGFNATAPYHVEMLADDYVMMPGDGYWVHVPADVGWVVDW